MKKLKTIGLIAMTVVSLVFYSCKNKSSAKEESWVGAYLNIKISYPDRK